MVSPGLRPLGVNKTGFNLIIFHFYIRGKSKKKEKKRKRTVYYSQREREKEDTLQILKEKKLTLKIPP